MRGPSLPLIKTYPQLRAWVEIFTNRIFRGSAFELYLISGLSYMDIVRVEKTRVPSARNEAVLRLGEMGIFEDGIRNPKWGGGILIPWSAIKKVSPAAWFEVNLRLKQQARSAKRRAAVTIREAKRKMIGPRQYPSHRE